MNFSVAIATGHLLVIVALCVWQPYFDGKAVAWGQDVGDTLRSPDGSVRSIDLPDTLSHRTLSRDLDVISLGLQVVPSPSGGTFFDEYRKLGGKVDELSAYIAPTMVARLPLNGQLRLTLYGAYSSVGFVDYYNATQQGVADSGGGVVLASLDENFSMSVIPVMVGLEYSPLYSQFSSYIGIAAGAALSSTSWTTTLRPQTPSNYYRPATNLRGLAVSPAARIYTGVDLRFDRYYYSQSPFRGIFLEASFLILPVAQQYFKEVRHQGKDIAVPPAADNAILNVGGFTMTLGVNLQFLRK